MPLPSERIAGLTSRAAAQAVLRLVAVWLGLGVLDLVTTGARWLVVMGTEPGDGSSALGGLTRLFGTRGGDLWLTYFAAIALVHLAFEGVALAWALRRDRTSPAVLLALGIAGIVARALSFAATITAPMVLARTEPIEALAAHNIASSVSATLYTVVGWMFAVVVLAVVFMRAVRPQQLEEREGPYREPA